MPVSLSQLRDAGAVRMLCMYQIHISGGDPSWIATGDFARREFRDAKIVTIKRLILECRKASETVKRLSFDVGRNGKPIIRKVTAKKKGGKK